MNPQTDPVRRAVARAAWLGELSHALDQAKKVTLALCTCEDHGAAVGQLRADIALLAREVEDLQRHAWELGDEMPLDGAL